MWTLRAFRSCKRATAGKETAALGDAEDTSDGNYLETTCALDSHNRLSYRLKNANENTSKIWRYHHYNSRLDYTTKRSILFSTLRKTNKMASDDEQLQISAIAKCNEFLRLGSIASNHAVVVGPGGIEEGRG